MTADRPSLVSLHEALQILAAPLAGCLSSATVDSLVKALLTSTVESGDLKPFTIGGRRLFRRADIDALAGRIVEYARAPRPVPGGEVRADHDRDTAYQAEQHEQPTGEDL
ncbi:hypothetical protein [Spongiactinospora sp. TRM90649]|uniref:hypothetical protein n=1 Tax=Spongiactinospora sp. TRM90649 TaxID=3031114 RepID=UPI0023F62AC0|nr:hypothetical protein [Spongiactinospora sp. TRM90649]MDF5758561.1 hypothetical protein [Spongiactinospora sp. TRM90649]